MTVGKIQKVLIAKFKNILQKLAKSTHRGNSGFRKFVWEESFILRDKFWMSDANEKIHRDPASFSLVILSKCLWDYPQNRQCD